MELIIEKLKKVKELAERGIEGEAQAAKEKLNLLLAKYNLSLSDIEEVKKNKYLFKYVTADEKTIAIQCISKVTDNTNVLISWYKNKKKEFFVEMTEWQYIEATSLIGFHVKQFRKEVKERMKAFRSAYCAKHHLFADSSTPGGKQMSAEEYALWIAAYSSMENHKLYQKEISQK